MQALDNYKEEILKSDLLDEFNDDDCVVDNGYDSLVFGMMI